MNLERLYTFEALKYYYIYLQNNYSTPTSVTCRNNITIPKKNKC